MGETPSKSNLDLGETLGILNEKAKVNCETSQRSQHKDSKLEKVMTQLGEANQRAQVLEAENKRLKEYLNNHHDKRMQKKTWIKNPFKNKTMK